MTIEEEKLKNSECQALLIKLGEYFLNKQNFEKVICYIKAALEIDYYHTKNDSNLLWMLYYSYWYNGDYENSKKYFDLCLDLNDIDNLNDKYLNDYRYYYNLPKISILGNYDINIIYPQEKIEIVYNEDDIHSEYLILSENITSNSTIMKEYLKKINNKNSKILDTNINFKVIYIE